MGKAVIQQPNGKFCIFSSVVDGITVYDCTEDELIAHFIEELVASAIRSARDAINRATGVRPQFRHIPTFEEAIAMHNRRHPDDTIDVKELS